jgi:hypothetical protein
VLEVGVLLDEAVAVEVVDDRRAVAEPLEKVPLWAAPISRMVPSGDAGLGGSCSTALQPLGGLQRASEGDPGGLGRGRDGGGRRDRHHRTRCTGDPATQLAQPSARPRGEAPVEPVRRRRHVTWLVLARAVPGSRLASSRAAVRRRRVAVARRDHPGWAGSGALQRATAWSAATNAGPCVRQS